MQSFFIDDNSISKKNHQWSTIPSFSKTPASFSPALPFFYEKNLTFPLLGRIMKTP